MAALFNYEGGTTRFQPIRRCVTGSIYIALGVTAAFAGSDKK